MIIIILEHRHQYLGVANENPARFSFQLPVSAGSISTAINIRHYCDHNTPKALAYRFPTQMFGGAPFWASVFSQKYFDLFFSDRA